MARRTITPLIQIPCLSMSTDPLVEITASLPFPLRINGGPHTVDIADGFPVSFTFTTERHEHPDQRVHGGGTFDYQEDRYGWASYTTVKASFVSPQGINPVPKFLTALNVAIETVRDALNLHWIHPLEAADLFRLTIGSGGQFQASLMPGRVGAVTLPVLDLSEGAKSRIVSAWAAGEQTQSWRLLQLDAKEALAMGRYEQSVVLAWSAVEAGVRGELPRLCRVARRLPADIWVELHCLPRKLVPFSHEQAAERGRILEAIRLCGELCQASHDPGSLAQSGRHAYELRNRVVHQGYRIGMDDAQTAWDATEFILRALDLPRRIALPTAFEDDNWVSHFGTAPSLDLGALLRVSTGRIVLFAEPKTSDAVNAALSVRAYGATIVVGLSADVTEANAATLAVLTRAGMRPPTADCAFLRVSESAKEILVAGLLDNVASIATQAAWFAYSALMQHTAGLPVEAACSFALERSLSVLSRSPRIARQDARLPAVALALSARSVHASRTSRSAFDLALLKHQPELAEQVSAMTTTLEALLRNAQDSHVVCEILRATHGRTMWLDSILVRCPQEDVEYGSRKWERPIA